MFPVGMKPRKPWWSLRMAYGSTSRASASSAASKLAGASGGGPASRASLGGGHADDRGPVGEHSLDEQIDRQVTDAAHLARREGEGVVP